MKIAIANDHRGVERKNKIVNHLKNLGHTVINCGTDSNESVDYPKYAFDVSKKVSNKEVDIGILLCGTGIGMSIAANKVKEVRKIAEGLIAAAVREKDNFDEVTVTAKVARKDKDGKRVKEVVDGKKVTVYDEVEKTIKKLDF